MLHQRTGYTSPIRPMGFTAANLGIYSLKKKRKYKQQHKLLLMEGYLVYVCATEGEDTHVEGVPEFRANKAGC